MRQIQSFSQSKRKWNIDVLYFFVFSVVFFSTFSKTIFSMVSIALIYVSVLGAMLFVRGNFITKYDMWILCLFYVLPFLWMIVSAINCFLFGYDYIAFLQSSGGRMANSVVYFFMYFVLRNAVQRGIISTEKILQAYCWGCIVLVFVGWWQFVHNTLGVPFLNITTRDHIHSMEGDIGIGSRITSLAEEPAYLVTYLIDLFIVIYYKVVPSFSNRTSIHIFLLTGIVGLLLFTLSLSGYLNFIFIIFSILIFMRWSKKKFWFVFFLSVIGLLIGVLAQNIVGSVLERLSLEDLLSSGRLQDGYLPVFYMFSEVSPFTLLFGYGAKGFDYMRQFVFYITGWLTGQPISVTSHVIFIDFFVEYGFVGLSLMIGLFCFLWHMACKVHKYGGGRFAQVLVLNLLVASLYTSDYASPRFTILLVIFVSLYNDIKKKMQYENISNYSNI